MRYILALSIFLFTGGASAQAFTVLSANDSAITVQLDNGMRLTLPLSDFKAKADIVLYLKSLPVPLKTTLSPALSNLVGKSFDADGNQLP